MEKHILSDTEFLDYLDYLNFVLMEKLANNIDTAFRDSSSWEHN